MTPNSLIHTSVDDARSTLKNMLETQPPYKVLALVADTFAVLDFEGIEMKTLRANLASAGRNAIRRMTF